VEVLEPRSEVGIATQTRPVTLLQDRGDLRGPRCHSAADAFKHEHGQTRREAEPYRLPADLRRSPLGVEQAEHPVELDGRRPGRGRRRVEPAQVADIPRAPCGTLQHEAGKVRATYLGHRPGRQRLVFLPCPHAPARTESSGPAPALIGGSGADPHGDQALQTGCMVQLRAAGPPRIHDHAHAGNGEA
jgi:hypothetical protein